MASELMGPEVDAWIFQEWPEPKATEVLVPVLIQVLPVWAHLRQPPSGPRCWQASLAVPLAHSGELDECGHHHGTQEEAWACGEALAKTFATALIQRRLDRGAEKDGAEHDG